MDPLAALKEARAAILAGNVDEALEALDNYAGWRRMGGFEPAVDFPKNCMAMGDEYADHLRCYVDGPATVADALPGDVLFLEVIA